ncbi:PREDICTED: uncharacterized protein LOC106302809 [Brassica oleracea var. oleracea]|uniref:uncharacterized protein LOC106302809 n=1 Tax=Brassica oleracea var. oleracea TaxID=109376 RepID=UPI0006A6C20D|nr:PREDICTED: uncharacterized protein LOC106302809 [Brassica oleracea var. oleracea]
MAPSFFCPLPTTTAKWLGERYTVHVLDRAVIGYLASTTESPEAVRDGYGGAYLTFFETCGLFFPILEPILSILAELVRAREEGLLFDLEELRHLVLMKRNNQNSGTFLMSPRPGCHIIHGILYRDQNWREEFFVFKIDEASVGNFDFSRLPRNWAENIAAFSMLDGSGVASEIAGAFEDEAEHSQKKVGDSSTNPTPSDRLERQLARRSSFRTIRSASAGKAASRLPPISILDSDDEGSPEARRPPVPLSPGLRDNSDAASRKRRHSSKAVMEEPSRSKRKSKGQRFGLEGDGPSSVG